MSREAQEGADRRWAEISEKLQNFYDAHKGLKEILPYVGEIPEIAPKSEV